MKSIISAGAILALLLVSKVALYDAPDTTIAALDVGSAFIFLMGILYL